MFVRSLVLASLAQSCDGTFADVPGWQRFDDPSQYATVFLLTSTVLQVRTIFRNVLRLTKHSSGSYVRPLPLVSPAVPAGTRAALTHTLSFLWRDNP